MSNASMGKLNDLINTALDLQERHESSGSNAAVNSVVKPKPLPQSKINVENLWSKVRHEERFLFSTESCFSHSSAIGEKFREIRANLQTLQVDKGVKTLAFSSAHHKEGKTHTVVNAARFLARHENRRTLLMDCDLRRPRVKEHIRVDCEFYLEDVLAEKCELTDALVFSEKDNLAVLLTRRGQHNATELLETLAMKKTIAAVRKMFDFVLIDTPPILSTTDPMVLGTMCDGVIMVVKTGSTQRESVEHAISLMYQSNAKVLGVILTQLKNHMPNYLYRYNYFNDMYADLYEYAADSPREPRKERRKRKK